MTTATLTPKKTAAATFTLFGLSGGGVRGWHDYTPLGNGLVRVGMRWGCNGEKALRSYDLPAERARQSYANKLKSGYRRVA